MSTFRIRLMMQSSKENFSKVPFYSHALEAGSFTLHLLVDTSDISLISYSINDPSFSNAFEISNVDSQTVDITVPVQKGDVVYWKGLGSRYNNTPNYNDDVFESTGLYEVGGNLMSLVCPNTSSFYANKFPTVIENYCFRNFFRNETELVSCDNLVINATTCGVESCKRLFYGCTSLVNPIKVLPATTLGKQCYMSMYANCSSLILGPELPATALSEQCYSNMFESCTSLVDAPVLPALVLTNGSKCYQCMFQDCTSLTIAPSLPATILGSYCYSSMFKGCSSLITAPELPSKSLMSYCYVNMFQNCTSLTESPTISVNSTGGAYWLQYMFSGCTSLNYIKFISTIAVFSSIASKEWVKNVNSNGIFVKHINDTYNETVGINGVPTNWTIIYFDPSTEKYYLSDKTTECDDHGNVI